MLALPALSTLFVASLSLELVHAHGINHHDIAKRQAAAVASSSSAAASGSSSTAAAATSTTAATASTTASAPSSTNTVAPSGTGTYNVPPLSSITSGMPAGAVPTLRSTFAAGSTPSYSGAPALPTTFVFSAADWPKLDVIPPTDSDEVKEWMKELDGVDIPDITPTKDNTCAGDPQAAAEAQSRGWWTCGGYTAETDITACPDKLTWGVSFDDGPAPYTPKILDFLDDHNMHATFFVVGSRVVSNPNTLITEYMMGNEISVHTWSHHPLTTMTNEQIVAELGWTRKAIQKVLGVTPTTMRPPFGDIDNRVRAISNAMGLRPIIWTRTPAATFDTNDWRVEDGTYTGPEQFQIFQNLLGNASIIDTGFIVLEHDLFETTVDLAVGYTLNAALTHNPAFKLKAIGECMSIPAYDMYQETAKTDIVGSSNSSSTSKSNSTGTGASSQSGAAGLRAPLAASASAFAGVAVAGAIAAFVGAL